MLLFNRNMLSLTTSAIVMLPSLFTSPYFVAGIEGTLTSSLPDEEVVGAAVVCTGAEVDVVLIVVLVFGAVVTTGESVE